MDTSDSRLQDGLVIIKVTPAVQALLSNVLDVVRGSSIQVQQMQQVTSQGAALESRDPNGIHREVRVRLADQYVAAKAASRERMPAEALYMHNKSLVQVLGKELTSKLYSSLHPLDVDVLHKYPLLYVSDFPKSSSDVLVGSAGSWTPKHQDLPLYCTSCILVLEGHKEFAVVPPDLAAQLPTVISSQMWELPHRHRGAEYPDLKSLVQAQGGVVVPLRAGELLVMPPRLYHFARNVDFTVSCNFSACAQPCVPITVAQTFARIDQFPNDVMHFDADFAELLEDTTNALLASTPQFNRLFRQAGASKLPRMRGLMEKCSIIMDWYVTLRCIPKDWVAGFWGERRDRLLTQLEQALPGHRPLPQQQAAQAQAHHQRQANTAAAAGAGAGGAGPRMGKADLARRVLAQASAANIRKRQRGGE